MDRRLKRTLFFWWLGAASFLAGALVYVFFSLGAQNRYELVALFTVSVFTASVVNEFLFDQFVEFYKPEEGTVEDFLEGRNLERERARYIVDSRQTRWMKQVEELEDDDDLKRAAALTVVDELENIRDRIIGYGYEEVEDG